MKVLPALIGCPWPCKALEHGGHAGGVIGGRAHHFAVLGILIRECLQPGGQHTDIFLCLQKGRDPLNRFGESPGKKIRIVKQQGLVFLFDIPLHIDQRLCAGFENVVARAFQRCLGRKFALLKQLMNPIRYLFPGQKHGVVRRGMHRAAPRDLHAGTVKPNGIVCAVYGKALAACAVFLPDVFYPLIPRLADHEIVRQTIQRS